MYQYWGYSHRVLMQMGLRSKQLSKYRPQARSAVAERTNITVNATGKPKPTKLPNGGFNSLATWTENRNGVQRVFSFTAAGVVSIRSSWGSASAPLLLV